VEGNNWAPPTSAPAAPKPKGPWWRRRWVLMSVGAVTALVVVGLVAPKGGSSSVHTVDAPATTQLPPPAAPTTSTAPAPEAPTTAAPPTTVAPTEPPTTVPPPPPSTEPPATTAAPSAPLAPAATSIVTEVLDGDTIVIETGEHIRFIGIDTPERGRCGSTEATANMRNMVYGKAVILTAGARDDVDKYGRLLRYVDLPDGTDTGLAQITGGYAVARYDSRDGYGRHDREEQYVAADTGAAFECVYGSATPAKPAAPAAPPTTASSGSAVYYANCAAARAAGVAPLHVGDPGYRKGLDRDGDGIACE